MRLTNPRFLLRARNNSRICRVNTHAIRPGPGDKQPDVELVKAARAYSAALEEAADAVEEDEVVAHAMGAKDSKSLSEVQEQYKDKIKEQIAKKAAELEAREEAGREEFNFGVSLYERGRYVESESMLRTALDVAGTFTKLGGDIQIQLALAMNATKKEEEACALLKNVEETHPVRAVARQAANIRFILEAPKLELSADEKISLPVMDLDANKPRNGRARAPARGGGGVANPKKEKTLEDDFLENYKAPSYIRNKYVWAAALVFGALAAYYSVYYKDCVPM